MTTLSGRLPALQSHVGGMPRQFWVLWWGQLGNRVGGIIRPFLALYLTSTQDRSVSEIGLLLSLIGFGGIFSQPVAGMLADRLGRRPVLIGALVASASAALCLSQAHSTWALAFFCVLAGFCADLYRPCASAAVADMMSPELRVRAYGLVFWAINLGFAFAAMLGGIVANLSYSAIFYVDAGTTLGFALLIYLRFPETQHAEHRALAKSTGSWGAVLRDRTLLGMIACVIANSSVYMQVDSTMAVVMRDHGIKPFAYGLIIGINGVLIVVLQPWATTVTAKLPRVRVMAVASVTMAVGFASTRLCGDRVWAYVLSLVVWTVGEIFQAGLFPSIVSDLAPGHLRGRYMGLFGLSFGVSAMLAPVLGTQMLAHGGETGLWLAAGNVMLLSGIGMGLLEPSLRARGAAGPESRSRRRPPAPLGA